MFCLATLIADQQKSCEKTPSSPLLIDTIEQHYAQFFLQQLKKLQQYEPKLPELISFLEQHFHNTAWGIVSSFSFPLGAQTQILKAIACECSRQTSQPPQDFLLPGVLLTYEQQQLDMTVLLATHILSSDKKKLIPAIAAFDEQQFEQLTPDEQHAVKHHSLHTHTYHKTLEYQRCSAPNHYDFLARLKQLRTALRHPQSSITCILEFEYYYKNTLSEKMRAAIPEPIRQSLELLLSSFASQHGNKAFGNNTLFMANPGLLDKFDFDYEHYYHLFNNTALRSFSSVSEQVPKDVTEQRGQQLIAFAPMGSQRGFARQQLLLKIGISLNINSIADLTILESIMPEEMPQIFIETQQPAPGHGALPQLALMLGGSNLLILFQRLDPAQVRAFCQLFPARTWIEALPVFEKLYRLLRFFREDKALTYAIISGLQLVLPDLLEHYTHKSQSSRHSLDSILHHSLFTPQELQWLDDALIAEITSLKKQSFFHDFLQRARPKSYFTHDFWVNKMYCDSKEIKKYLPYLPAPTQNHLIKRLLGQMLSPESIITPDVRTLLFYFTLSKKNKLPEYNNLMRLFNQDNQIMLCHLLAQSHESRTFIQDFFDIIHVILLNQPKHTMRFLINCTRHYPTWHMLTYPQYFLALAESFVHRIPHCHRILISALAGSLTWPMNEQNRSTPSVFRHLAAVAQKDIHFAQSLCAHPATHFSIFYNNSAEQVEVLNLLTRMSPHSPVRQLYDDAKRDDFALLKEQMLTEDPTTALRAIGLWVRFVALRGSAAECQIFFHEIFLEVVKKHANSLVISGSEHTEQLMKSLSPDHQKTFKHFLLTLPIFNSLSKKIRQSVLESAMRHIRQESSFLCAFFKESGVMRSVLYENLKVFDMTFDRVLIRSIDDLRDYMSAVFHHSHRQEPLQQVFLRFFQQPEQAQDLCQSPEDWALWFDLVPAHKKEACFNSLFSSSLAMLQPVLAKPCFTNHLARKTAEELRALMNQPLPVPLIAQSLVLMGLDPQSLLKHCSELGEQRRSAFVTLINSPKFFLPLLPQISVKKQYHWLIWAISDILSELLDHTHTPNFEFFCFKPVLSRASFQDIAHLINTHNGGGRALSTLISLGTPFATIADALLSLGAEQYHLLWQELQGSLAPGRLSELFACTHQPMSIAERQQLARCLYHTNPERLEGYRSFFEHLNSLEPFHTQHTPFCRYFSHFDSIAQLLHGESFPQHLKSFIVKALMDSECSWLRSLPMTQEQFSTISSYLTPEQQNYVRYCVGITSDDERSEPLTSTQSFLLSQKQPPSCDDLFRLWDMLEEGDLTSIHGSSSISSSHSTSPSKKPRY